MKNYYTTISPKFVGRFIMLLDAAILWCYGWKRWKLTNDVIWIDPLHKNLHSQKVAIKIQESRNKI